MSSGSPTIPPTVIRGFRLAYGSWKIICIRRRIRRRAAPSSGVRSTPSKMIEPAVGLYRRTIARPVVLLPQPDSPTRPSVSPRRISKSIAVDRPDVADVALEDEALGDREPDPQVADLSRGCRSSPAPGSRRAPGRTRRPARRASAADAVAGADAAHRWRPDRRRRDTRRGRAPRRGAPRRAPSAGCTRRPARRLERLQRAELVEPGPSGSLPGGGAATKPSRSGRRRAPPRGSAGCSRRSGGSPRARSSPPACPAPTGGERRVLAPAALEAPGAARRERAADRRQALVRRPALDRDQLLARPRSRGAGSSAAGRPCTGGDGRANRSGVVAVSTTKPAYITLIRWVIPATTPRSWVMRMRAVPVSCRQPLEDLEDLGLDRHVEGGRRLVGDEQLRLEGEGHGDHHPLAHPARELVREALAAASRAAGCRPSRGARSPGPGRPPWSCSRWAWIVSTICSSIVRTGFRLVIGSWKIIAMSRPRMVPHLVLREGHQVLPVEQDLAALDPTGRLGQEPHDRQVRDALAAAGLADEPERLALGRRRSRSR